MTESYTFLNDCAAETLDEDEFDTLLNLGDSVIDALFNEFLVVDNASVAFYSETTEWVRNYCRERIDNNER